MKYRESVAAGRLKFAVGFIVVGSAFIINAIGRLPPKPPPVPHQGPLFPELDDSGVTSAPRVIERRDFKGQWITHDTKPGEVRELQSIVSCSRCHAPEAGKPLPLTGPEL